LLALVVTACGVDDRPLSYEFHALEAAGTSGGGASNAGNGDAAEAGSSMDAGGHAFAGAPAGEAGAAANSAAGAGDAGAPSGGHSTGGDSAGEANAGGGVASGGSANVQGGTGGGTGEGGSAPNFPCGDLNHDLVDDCTQTLVQNSRFDTATTGWDAEPPLTETWNANNASGKPGSGSLALNHTGTGGTMLGAHQCIPAIEYATYDVAARVMLSAGDGKAGVNVFLFEDSACQGNLVVGKTPFEGGVLGQWTEKRGTLWIPAGVHSMYVRLFADKPSNQETLSVLIDDVLITRAPGD
jgi:hypothetical protein